MALNALKGRLARERKTIDMMIGLFCRHHHGSSAAICPSCDALASYARERLVHCPFGADKPTCLNCQVHCYRSDMRERVRAVMRDAGPRMLLRHPILTVLHLYWDSRREAPERARGRVA